MKLCLLFTAVLILANVAASAQKAPFTASEMMRLKRISEPNVAPDGHAVVFTVGEVDVEKNAQDRQLWVVSPNGTGLRRLTTDGRNTSARFSPDSKTIAFISTRGGSSQIWTMDADGGNAMFDRRLGQKGYNVADTDPPIDQPLGEAIGGAARVAIGNAAPCAVRAALAHEDRIWRASGLFVEDMRERFGDRAEREARAQDDAAVVAAVERYARGRGTRKLHSRHPVHRPRVAKCGAQRIGGRLRQIEFRAE